MAARLRFSADPLRLALVAWLALGIAASVRTAISPVKHSVFPIFAASAAHWWADRPLYDLYPGLDTFRYPPIFAVAVTPFAALGQVAGGILWTWTSIAGLLGGLWCFVRDVAPGRWTRPRRAAFLALAAAGAARGLWNNQSNALAVGLLLLASSAIARAAHSEDEGKSRRGRRWWRAALLLAAPVCLKLTPLAPALLLCVLWPRRLAGRFAVAVAAGFLVPFLTRGPEMVLGHYTEWLDHLQQSRGERWGGFRDAWTFWLAVRHLAGGLKGPFEICRPFEGLTYRMVQGAAALAVLAWCLWQRGRGRRLGLGAGWLVHVALAAGLAWLMLFGPAVEHATYVFLAPALMWAVVQREMWGRGRGLVLAAFALVMLLGWGAVARAVMNVWPAGGPLLLAALPLGSALFVLWLAGYAFSCSPRAALAADASLWDEIPREDEWDAPPGEGRPSRRRSHSTAAAA
jgi:hypothetical protein